MMGPRDLSWGAARGGFRLPGLPLDPWQGPRALCTWWAWDVCGEAPWGPGSPQ